MAMANGAAARQAAAALTLDQRRAADAWRSAQDKGKDYANLAKGLPALIMNSGLLQVMAFLHEKGGSERQRHCRLLGDDLRAWLHNRFHDVPAGFPDFMAALMKAEPRKFQTVTAEALAWLRWLRQLAAAINP
jgi:CRISPR-associated protein Cmr5